MMNHQSTLTAAETLMLLFPRRSSAADLLKITFSELCLLNILSVKKEYAYTSSRSDREALYTFVYFHQHEYHRHTLKPHQEFITSIFAHEHKLKITSLSLKFKKIIKSLEQYKRKYVFPGLELRQLLLSDGSSYSIDLYKHTTEGQNTVAKLKEQILKAEHHLPKWIATQQIAEISEFLEGMKTSILVLQYCWLENEVDWKTLFPKVATMKWPESNLVNSGLNQNLSFVAGFVWGGSFSSGFSVNYTDYSFEGGEFGGAGAGDSY